MIKFNLDSNKNNKHLNQLKDLFLDIAAEELSHMEMVAQTINLLNGHDVNYKGVAAGEIETHVLSGLAPFLINSYLLNVCLLICFNKHISLWRKNTVLI